MNTTWPTLAHIRSRCETYLFGHQSITRTAFHRLAVVQIGFRNTDGRTLDRVFFQVQNDDALKPVKEFAVTANKGLDLLHQHIRINDLLCVKIEYLEEFLIRGLVPDMTPDLVKELNLVGRDGCACRVIIGGRRISIDLVFFIVLACRLLLLLLLLMQIPH